MAAPPIPWHGGAITALSLHKPVPTFHRLDTTPFLLTYATWLAITLSLRLDTFWAVTGAVILALLHVLTLLAQHWSVYFATRVAYRRVSTPERGVVACVTPRQHRGAPELVPILTTRDGRCYFEFQRRSYEYVHGAFAKVRYPKDRPLREYGVLESGGPSDQAAEAAFNRYGANLLEIPMPEFWDMYKKNLLSPFFVFQVFSIGLWMLDEYWRYSLLTLGMMLFSEAMVVKGRQRSLRELRGMRNKVRRVHVLRNRKWVSVSTLELVPGDVMSLTRDLVPCDMVILAGSTVVNEAMLTGESVPLIKEAVVIEGDDILDIKKKHKNHVVFGGTQVLTHTPAAGVGKAPDNGCICYVLRTGFGSSQGKLMRTIMFSTEKVSSDAKDAWMLILFLLAFAITASGYVLVHGMHEGNQSRYKLLLHCVMIVTSVVPPELPMQLSLAVNSSLLSLVKSGVFCTEPFRIPFAGKVDVCCFDKTGTLTTDLIKAVGVGGVGEGGDLTPVADISVDGAYVLAGCHSLVHVGKELVGDPLELEALSAVDWNFSKSDTAVAKKSRGSTRPSLRIIHRNRFISTLQRMSVIAQIDTNENRLLVKGSAEAVKKLLKSVPAGYDEGASTLARKGMRVLAIAYRKLEGTLAEIRSRSREDLENELIFVSFIAFECPLRPDSRKVMKALRASSHIVCMITGDATPTAAHVAKEAGLTNKPVAILDETTMDWVSAQTGKRKKRFVAKEIPEIANDFALCVSGSSLERAFTTEPDTWKHLTRITVFARMNPDLKERVVVTMRDHGYFTLMCGDGTNDVGALKQADVGVALISSSTGTPPSPQNPQKPASKEKAPPKAKKTPGQSGQSTLQSQAPKSVGPQSKTPAGGEDPQEVLRKRIEELTASMDAEENTMVRLGDASVAAPFTSKAMTVESCAKVIRQGRCTQATALQMYQILALNSLVQAYSLSVLHLDGVKFGEHQMTIVGFAMTAAYFMMSRSRPLHALSVERPAKSIFAPSLFVSLLGQFAIHLAVLIITTSEAKVFLPKDYLPDVEGEFATNILNTVVFLISTAQQVVVFAVNFRGRPFMEGLMENTWLKRTLGFCLALVFVVLTENSADLNKFLEVSPFPNRILQARVGAAIVIDFVACFVWDRLMRRLF